MKERPVPFAASFYAAAVTTCLTGPEDKRGEARALIAEYGHELCADARMNRQHGQDPDGLAISLGPLVRELLDERLGGRDACAAGEKEVDASGR